MGWAAAGLVVLLPGPLALSLRYWPETLGAFFFAAVCLTLVQAERIKTRTSRFAGAGLLCGLLCGANERYQLDSRGRRLDTPAQRRLAVRLRFSIAALGALSLVPLRNYLVTRTWVLTPTEGAVTMVLGSNIPRNTNISFGLQRVTGARQSSALGDGETLGFRA